MEATWLKDDTDDIRHFIKNVLILNFTNMSSSYHTTFYHIHTVQRLYVCVCIVVSTDNMLCVILPCLYGGDSVI